MRPVYCCWQAVNACRAGNRRGTRRGARQASRAGYNGRRRAATSTSRPAWGPRRLFAASRERCHDLVYPSRPRRLPSGAACHPAVLSGAVRSGEHRDGAAAIREPGAGSGQLAALRAAASGFRNYWYPVLFGAAGTRPLSVTLLGERIVLVRDAGRVYALHDRCPHRGVPLSAGRCASRGRSPAPTTAGPTSSRRVDCGRAHRRPRFADRGRANVAHLPGRGARRARLGVRRRRAARPGRSRYPDDLLQADAVIEGLIESRPGNWRYAVENGIDEGHAKLPAPETPWSWFHRVLGLDPRRARSCPKRGWPVDVVRVRERVGLRGHLRGHRPLAARALLAAQGRGSVVLAVGGLPATRPGGPEPGGWLDDEIFVPVDDDHHRAVLLSVKHARGLSALQFRLRCWLCIRWLYRGLLGESGPVE